MWPAHAKSSTKPLSGWMCEDVQHDLAYSFLSTLPQSFRVDGLLKGTDTSAATTSHLGGVAEIMPRIKQVYLRLSSAIVFALRGLQLYWCTQEDLDEDPRYLTRVNRKITEGRRLCEADIKVALQLIEQIFSIRSCSTNGHSAVCQLVRNMKTKGAPRFELGIERAVSTLHHCII